MERRPFLRCQSDDVSRYSVFLWVRVLVLAYDLVLTHRRFYGCLAAAGTSGEAVLNACPIYLFTKWERRVRKSEACWGWSVASLTLLPSAASSSLHKYTHKHTPRHTLEERERAKSLTQASNRLVCHLMDNIWAAPMLPQHLYLIQTVLQPHTLHK